VFVTCLLSRPRMSVCLPLAQIDVFIHAVAVVIDYLAETADV